MGVSSEPPPIPVRPTRPPISSPVSVNCQVIFDWALAAVGRDQHLCDLGPRELDRRQLARRKQLPHLRAGEEDVIVSSVWAGLGRGHLAADLAPERVLEEHRLDIELVRLEVVEDQLRVIRAVVVADARVVATDNEVRAAVVLPADRMPDRLSRTCVAHCGRERRKHDAVLWVVVLEQDPVALDTRCRRYVVGLGVADQGVDQQSVDRFERALREVLVRAVDRVAGLEANHALPSTLCENRAGLRRIERKLRERRPCALEDRHFAGQIERLLLVEPGDAGVRRVRGPKRVPRLALLVVFEDLVHLEHGDRLARLVGQCDLVVGRRSVEGETDGQRPGQALRQPHLFEHTLVVLPAHEALERRERAGSQHVEVGQLTRGERNLFQAVRVVGPRARAVDEISAVGRDQMRLRLDRHQTPTRTPVSPRAVRTSSTLAALSSGDWDSVSSTSSGADGSSYGSETPVNSLISPLNAFSYRPLTSRLAQTSTEAFTKTSTKSPCSSMRPRALRRVSS